MEYQTIVAVVRRNALPAVEARLVREQAPGITVSPVKGYGEYANYFCKDMLVPHVRIEILAGVETINRLVAAIAEAAHTGMKGDGFIGVLPVQRVVRIRTGRPPESDQP